MRTAARRRDERGAVAIMVAFLAITLFVIAALVVDLGLARDTRRQSQNAADASALAAANQLYLPTASGGCPTKPCVAMAVAAAKSYAAINYGTTDADWAACTDVGRPASYVVPAFSSPCISFDQIAKPTKVRVTVPGRDIVTGLGRAAGVDEVTVAAGAEAQVAAALDIKCGLCFMGGVSPGNADYSVSPGGIAVNGDINANPGSLWSAGAIGVSGTTTGGNFTPAATKIPPFTDPFASMILPAVTGTAKSDPCEDGPGRYGSVSISKGTCTLTPGTYVITGTWDMKNGTLLRNDPALGGVTLYVTTGTLDFKNGDVSLTPTKADGVFKGMTIVYSRSNSNPIILQGNGNTSITGKVYAVSSVLDFNGNSCFGFEGGPVVVKSATGNGTKGCVTVTKSVDATVATTPGDIGLSK
ncbi:pilus assembly protein TadG-related protein [Nocardioides sp. LHG3406-4]|uniref:pilus assembly protein TadG-related protein n=1 Tax=Nocardioides sp. LHG3406-4 TaxID=2804575 RepID=UPI003CF03530